MLEHIGSLSVRAQRLANVRAHRLAELALTMPHSHGHALESSWCAHSRDAQHVGISHLSRHIMLVSRISLDISSWYLASLLTHHVGISRRGPEPKASGNRGPEPKASGNRGLASNLAILSCGTPGSPWKPKEAQGCPKITQNTQETFVRNNNPLFSKETGIVPEAVLVVDWLHCLSLGVYKYFIAALWNALFQQDVFRVWSQRARSPRSSSLNRA